MPEEQLIPVNIVVADRTYRLRIKPGEEEDIRKVMKEVNAKIVEFKTAYAGKDLQDFISMCLIWYATQSVTAKPGLSEEVQEFLLNMEVRMDEVLEENETS